MSVLTFRDQTNQPVWGLATRIARGHGDTHAAEDERYPDRAGTTAFVGVKLVLPSLDGHTVHVNYNEGLNPAWASYTPVSVYLPDIEAIPSGYTITVLKSGTTPPPPGGGLTTLPCPSNGSLQGFGTVQEWKTKAHEIVSRRGLTVINQANLQIFDQECQAIHPFAEVQFSSGGTLRPRLHLPTSERQNVPDCGKYARPCDFGDDGKPFFHDSTSTDVWIPTGRPPSSRW